MAKKQACITHLIKLKKLEPGWRRCCLWLVDPSKPLTWAVLFKVVFMTEMVKTCSKPSTWVRAYAPLLRLVCCPHNIMTKKTSDHETWKQLNRQQKYFTSLLQQRKYILRSLCTAYETVKRDFFSYTLVYPVLFSPFWEKIVPSQNSKHFPHKAWNVCISKIYLW